jgi:hypothetical protein
VTKILGGDFLSHFPLIKDKESLSPHISFLPDTFDEVEYSPATPHMYDINIERFYYKYPIFPLKNQQKE